MRLTIEDNKRISKKEAIRIIEEMGEGESLNLCQLVKELRRKAEKRPRTAIYEAKRVFEAGLRNLKRRKSREDIPHWNFAFTKREVCEVFIIAEKTLYNQQAKTGIICTKIMQGRTFYDLVGMLFRYGQSAGLRDNEIRERICEIT